jgi:hypothetical protein
MNYKTITLASIFLITTQHANDTTVTVAAGGIITPKKDPDIVMKKERLTISPKKINVEYEFVNTSETKTVIVAFPLPKSPYTLGDVYPYASWDEAQIASRILYGDREMEHASLKSQLTYAPLIDFKLSSDDRAAYTTCSMRAYTPDGVDITDILKQHNIPLSAAYLRGFIEQPPMDKFPGLKEKLKSLNLTDTNGLPNWQLQTTYFWNQTFEKGKLTKVTHAYTPHTGEYNLRSEDLLQPSKTKLKINYPTEKHFTIDLNEASFDKQNFDQFLEKLKKNRGAFDASLGRLQEVKYILTTGANWKGSIESFTLIIKPNSPDDLIIIKGKHPTTRNRDGSVTVHYTNFVPKEDLTVWFFRIK